MKNFSRLVPMPTPVTSYGIECMEKIRQMLAHPKPSGNWWAKEIMSKVAAGEQVTLAAYNIAKAALRNEAERQAGEDLEEDDDRIPM